MVSRSKKKRTGTLLKMLKKNMYQQVKDLSKEVVLWWAFFTVWFIAVGWKLYRLGGNQP
jgi:hypothetical protein